MKSFSYKFQIESSDIDAQGHVNNVAYVRWIQDVAVAHWLAAADLEIRERFTWVVLRHEIDYKKASFEGEEVEVKTWVDEPDRITWTRFTEVVRGDELIVKARSVWCLIGRERDRPTRISNEIRQLLS